MYKDARTLIIEQEKEIEQLTEERNRYAETLAKYQKEKYNIEFKDKPTWNF